MDNIQFFLLASIITCSPALSENLRNIFGSIYLLLAIFFTVNRWLT